MLGKKQMKAIQYFGYGGGAAALKHVEVPVPEPKANEVLIKVEASALNPLDCKIQKGFLRPFLPRKFPHIPGSDLAGEIVQVGPGVKKFKAGDKVVCIVLKGGALAEYVVANEASIAARPAEQVSAAQGAGLPMAALSAYEALTEAGIRFDGSTTGEKKNVLVTGGSGGVGHYAIQLAKLGNNHVTATCGARNLDLVKSLGADEVLDYRTPEGAALRSPSGNKYDSVIHCAATGIPWSVVKRNLSSNGRVIDLTPGAATVWNFAVGKLTLSKQQLVPFVLKPRSENLENLVKLVEQGKLKTLVNSTYPLTKAEDAWAKLIDGHNTGKIIVLVVEH